MCTFQRRFTITPLAIIRPETLESSQAPGGYIHRCYQTIFPGAHKVETVLSQVLILRLSEPRHKVSNLPKVTSVETQWESNSQSLDPKADALTTAPPHSSANYTCSNTPYNTTKRTLR